MKMGKVNGGGGENRKEEQVFGVTGHPELARYCKCLSGNIN